MSSTLQFLITGSTGYVGSQISAFLGERGHVVRGLNRSKKNGEAFTYKLGEKPPHEAFNGVDVLIHCAYDMKAIKWGRIYGTNVEGTRLLLKAAKEAGVKKIILISSISAFEGSSSLYGKAKLLMEEDVLNAGGAVVRPGLVYGEKPGGMIGTLTGLVKLAKIIPIVGGSKKMYLCHQDDLSELLLKLSSDDTLNITEPFIAASQNGHTFRDILSILAERLSKDRIFFPVPWQCAWLALKVFELSGRSLGFKSDSLKSLMNPNPALDFAFTQSAEVHFRDFLVS